MLTDQDYLELKTRLSAEGLLIKKNEPIRGQLKQKQMHFLDRAYHHFRERQQILYDISKRRGFTDWCDHNLSLTSYGWDNIRHLTCWAYGVNVVTDLPDDKQDEINDFAIHIIEHAFDQYAKMWEDG